MRQQTQSPLAGGRVFAVVFVLVCGLLALGGTTVHAQCGEWELVSPTPHGRDLADVVWGNDRFVAVGYSVTQVSPDGESWDVTIHDGVHLNAVAWDGTAFVAVGDGGVILRSEDGQSWEQLPSPTTADLRGVAWGAGQLVAAGGEGVVLRSMSGHVWEPVSVGTAVQLNGVIFGRGRFYVFGDGAMVEGHDGVWTAVLDGNRSIKGAAVLGGELYITDRWGSLYVHRGAAFEEVLVSWQRDLSFPPRGDAAFSLGSGEWMIRWLPGGSMWVNEEVVRNNISAMRAVAVGGGHAVAVGSRGESQWREPGGIWKTRRSLPSDVSDLAHNGRIIVAAMSWAGCVLFSSSDGREWTCRLTAPGRPSFVRWLGDRFVLVTGNAPPSPAAFWSADGVTWSPLLSLPDGTNDIVRMGDRYLAVTGRSTSACAVLCWGVEPRIYSSENLENWDQVWEDSEASELLRAVSNGSRVLVTRWEARQTPAFFRGLVVSDDGVNWLPVSFPSPLYPGTVYKTHDLIWTGSEFVIAWAGRFGSNVYRSSDGLTWDSDTSVPFWIESLAWTGTEMLATGFWQKGSSAAFPVALRSQNGSQWAAHYPLVQPRFLGACPASMSGRRTVGTEHLQIAAPDTGVLLRRECVDGRSVARRRLGRSGAVAPAPAGPAAARASED